MTTISKIQDIANVGVYASKDSVKSTPKFLRYNLIYGFNGSGKTTLSRLFSSLGSGSLHSELPPESKFKVACQNGEVIQQNTQMDLLKDKVLVFNVEFIKDNFTWEESQASTIVYLGTTMKNAAAELKSINKKIEGNQKQLEANTNKLDELFKDEKETYRLLGSKIKREIRTNQYTAANVKKDLVSLEVFKAQQIPEDEYLAAKKTLELPKAKDKLQTIPPYSGYDELSVSVLEACNLKTTFELAEDLVGWDEILTWIKEGIGIHKDHNLKNCKFCNNELFKERIDSLERSLDKSYDLAVGNLNKIHENLQRKIESLNASRQHFPRTPDLYNSFEKDAEKLKQSIYQKIDSMSRSLVKLQSKILEKREDLSAFVDVASKLEELKLQHAGIKKELSDLNKIIDLHNDRSDGFETEKSKAINAVKLYLLMAETKTLKSISKKTSKLQADNQNDENVRNQLIEKRNDLTNQVSDEGKAVDIVNIILSDYLGHKELTLALVDKGYKIYRHGKEISGSISEGEKTAISLCYFISKLNEDGNKAASRIIVVDDPISSLDSKAQNYACGLIKEHLNDASQLFVLTHNLHFMNECKKWLRNRTKTSKPDGSIKDPTARFFFLETLHDEDLGRRRTIITDLPKLLSEYDTEYHFLFSQVYQTSIETDNKQLHAYYILPNVVRKILETFFSFKFPRNQNFADNFQMKRVQDTGIQKAKLEALKRLSELESHGQSLDTLTSLSHINIEEIKEATRTTMELIEALDVDHFKEMKKKCNKVQNDLELAG